MLLTERATLFERDATGEAEREGPTVTFSSTIVFHSPHEGHLPTHLGESAPQELQNH
jgi:hypothetical protein